jgi:hypothetical protein
MGEPSDREKAKYRWTILPQVFTDSPNLFGQVSEQVLEEFAFSAQMNLLQYGGDLLYLDLPRKR